MSTSSHALLDFTCRANFCTGPKQPRLRCRDSPAAESSSSRRSWFSQAGIVCPKIGLSEFSGLRGVVALGDTAAGEVLATVPYDSCLVVEPLKRCPFPAFCDAEYWKSSPWFVKVSVELLYEKIQVGTTSRLRHYIADLVAIKIETPVEWADIDIRELQYPALERETLRQRVAWEGLYQAFAAASPDSKVSMADFLWALQAVRSRAFSGPYGGARLGSRMKLAALLATAGLCSLVIAHLPFEQVLNAGIAAVCFNIIYDFQLSRKLKWYALCPVIDYCNHSGTISSDVSYEYFKEGFSLSCSQAFSTGDQVFISYGKQSNDYLLQYYGFVELNNTNDKYIVYDPSAAHTNYLELTAQGPSPETELMLLQELADTEAVIKAVVEACEAETGRWPTSLQQDREQLARLQSSPQAHRLKLAIMFRIEKKALVGACIAHCRTKLGRVRNTSRLDSLTY